MIETYLAGLSLDRKFQDWMVDQKLIKRSPDTKEQLQERFGYPTGLRSGERELWEILLAKHGYIMAEMEIQEDWTKVREAEKVPQYSSIRQYIMSLRRSAKDPTIIFNVHGLGYSVGIEGAVMACTETHLLAKFWRYTDHWLAKEELDRYLYGEREEDDSDRVRQQVHSLNKYLKPRGYSIQNSYNFYEGFKDITQPGLYRLHEEFKEYQMKMAI